MQGKSFLLQSALYDSMIFSEANMSEYFDIELPSLDEDRYEEERGAEECECTCIECTECEGQGVIVPYQTKRFGPVDFNFDELPKCPKCKGSCKNTTGCELHEMDMA